MLYLAVKHLHVTFVGLSFLGFFARGILMMTDSSLLRTRLVRVTPHVIDTVLLASALALLGILRQIPGSADWLVAKLVGLVVYIGLGTQALKAGRPKRVRIAFWLLAMSVFGWIVSVALTKNPAGWFSLL